MRESVLILCRNERETILYAAEELKRYLSLAGASAWTSVRETHSPYMKILELAVTPEEFWGKEGQCMEFPPLRSAECRRLRHHSNGSRGIHKGVQ